MKTITTIIMLAAIFILIGWDIFVAARPPEGDTISEIIRQSAFRHPIIPFAFGVLIGHFFWSN